MGIPAEILRHAAGRLRAARGRPRVVKLGGSAMEDPAATAGMVNAVVALQNLGLDLILVHGGGKPIDRAMATAGLTPVKVQGRRYTDDATLEIVVRVLFEINADLVAKLTAAGGTARGFAENESQFPLRGGRLMLPGADGPPVDLGRVGTVDGVNSARLREPGMPVLPSLAIARGDGGWLNVNADTAAGAVAGVVNAEAVYFLTDTPGVLKDRHDPASLIPTLTAAECRGLIASGVIAGGMVPKVEACLDALAAGAGKAVILDGRDPDSLLAEFLPGVAAGTAVVP